MTSNSESLKDFLDSRKLWYKFIEFDEPVKTVKQASGKVRVERIAKSMVLVASDGQSLLTIVPAKNRVSYGKIKGLLNIRDVRLASPDETLEHSGYPAGGVPRFNKIQRGFWTRRSSITKLPSLAAGIYTA